MCGREVAKNLFLGKRETRGIRMKISNTSNGKKVQVIKYSVYITKSTVHTRETSMSGWLFSTR